MRHTLLSEEPEWWSPFKAQAKVRCQDGLFCEPANNCFVPDDGEVRRLFDDANVHFVWRPDKAAFSDFQPVYRVLNVPYLSEAVAIALADDAGTVAIPNPRFVTDARNCLPLYA